MKFKRIMSIVLTAVLLCTLLSSCTSSLSYTGAWKEIDNNFCILRLKAGNKFTYAAIDYFIEGTYEITEDPNAVPDKDGVVWDNITLTYETVTYTNEEGEEVTEPFFCYTSGFATVTETRYETDFSTGQEVEITEEVEKYVSNIKTEFTKPLSGKVCVKKQEKANNLLTIMVTKDVTETDEDTGETTTKSVTETWKFERTFESDNT